MTSKPHVCLDNWEISTIPAHMTEAGNSFDRLIGQVRNHPCIPDGYTIFTSAIKEFDIYGSWIETKNTIYILGVPKDMGESS